MEFRCEDLAEHDLVLIPPSSAEYATLVADVRRRIRNPVEGGPPLPTQMRPHIVEGDRETSAVFLNRSKKAAAAFCWIWRSQDSSGREVSSTNFIGAGGFPSILLPFALDEERRAFAIYWHTVLPGSKRYLGGGRIIGDNRDVRPPHGSELWKGGVGAGGGGGGHGERAWERVTLAMDGIFFADGEFVGPNRGMLWERVTSQADAVMQVAQIARKGRLNGVTPAPTFVEIEAVMGPLATTEPIAPDRRGDPEQVRRHHVRTVANWIAGMRLAWGDERTIDKLSDWADTELPKFRR